MSEHAQDQQTIDLTKPPAENMVRVTFQPEGKTVEFPFGTMPYDHHGLPMSLPRRRRELRQSFSITPAAAFAPAPPATYTSSKARPASTNRPRTSSTAWRKAPGLQLNSRLGCQAVIEKPGSYTVEIPSWNKNYVSEGKPLTLSDSK